MTNNNIIDERNNDIQIYINGSFYPRNDAKISVFDSGFLLGDGIWEGIRLVKNEWLSVAENKALDGRGNGMYSAGFKKLISFFMSHNS